MAAKRARGGSGTATTRVWYRGVSTGCQGTEEARVAYGGDAEEGPDEAGDEAADEVVEVGEEDEEGVFEGMRLIELLRQRNHDCDGGNDGE